MNIVFPVQRAAAAGAGKRRPPPLRHLGAAKLLPEAFFEAVNAEIDAGGVEALHHHLLNLDLGDFKPWTRRP